MIFRQVKKALNNLPLAARFSRCLVNKKFMPLNLDFHITKHCNLKCIHCYAALETLKETPDYTLDEIKSVIDQAHAMGVRWIRLLGGEPLLRKDVGEIIRYIKSKRIFCEVNTNGMMIPYKLKELAPVDAICLSLDGPRDENDKVRGQGSFEKIVKGIEAAVAAGHTPRLHAVLTKYNIHTLEQMNEIACKYNLRFNYNHCALENYSDPNFVVSRDETSQFCEKLLSAKAKKYRISNSKTCIRLMSKWPVNKDVIGYDDVKADPRLKKTLPECQMGYKAVYVDADGFVYACPRRWKHGISWREHGLEKAWKHCLAIRPCYVCKEMAIIERGLIFGGDVRAITNAFVGFA